MNISLTRASLACVSALLLAQPAMAMFHKEGPTPDEARAEIQTMKQETLEQLYKENPDARSEIKSAKGYAVFSNFGMNLFLLSTGRGAGVAHDNGNGNETYMKMFSAGGGLGMGVKKFRAVFIFHTAKAFDDFVEKGWDFSGQADAAATTDADNSKDAGAADAAATATQGVTVYQLTDQGLALQATLQGTKYWQDEDLN